jgi:endoglucanase
MSLGSFFRALHSAVTTRSLLALVFFLTAACGPLGSQARTMDPLALPEGGPDGQGTAAPEGGTAEDTGTADSSIADQAAPGGYVVVGPTIYDANHKAHLFHGVDRSSLEWNAAGQFLSMQDYALMAGWKANVVRISLNQDFWLQGGPQYAAGYEATVDQQIQWAEAAGLDVILDLHWSDRGNLSTTAAQQRMADVNSVTFWGQVASRYMGDGHVLFELYNEPHDVAWSVWLGGGPSGDGFTVAGMQALYDAVRKTGAQNLVLIAGLDWAFDLSGVQSNRVKGTNIVWVSHAYGQNSNQQAAAWNGAFGFLSAMEPVMLTEFGDTKVCDGSYDSAIIAFADAHHISWSGFAWYVAGCAFPTLIADWNATPTAAGKVVKTALLGY